VRTLSDKYITLRIEDAKTLQKSEPLSQVARILPPLLGNLKALEKVWTLTQTEKEDFKKIEEWLNAFSQKKLKGSVK
jgi:transposase